MSRLRLLKLLYIADRELLIESARTITGDHAYAMKNGPVLTQIYDLIKGEGSRAGEWDDFIHSDGYRVELKQEPGRSQLSKQEVEKLIQVAERFRNWDDFEISEYTHGFAEWKNNFHGDETMRIPWDEVLRAENKGELIAIAEKNSETSRYLDDLFGP